MNSDDDKVRAAIAEQAGEWFVMNEEGPLDARDSTALTDWLKVSPVHVEEFLGVSAVVRDLREAGTDPEYSLEAILARARAEEESPVRQPSRRWVAAALAVAACALLSIGLLLFWNARTDEHSSAPDGMVALHLETRHGEQLTRRLADNSMVHLNTDSAVTIQYGKTERLVTLTSGQAEFEVVHDPARAFRVIAGSAEVVDLGTQFDVRLEHGATVVTVVDGRVVVGPSQSRQSQFVRLGANQQISVAAGEWPAVPTAVDAQNTTAWLRREIVFDHEPLALVAAEFNRYTDKPIEIVTPALRNLQISGVFAIDNTDAFIAFLRSLKGVRVEVTATEVRVSRD
jgi:transmembrane sensor